MSEQPQTDAATDDLKLIRLNSRGIHEPDNLHAADYSYKLVVHLSPPEFMHVTFILLHGGSEELIVRGKTRDALDRFITKNDLTQHPRLRSMTITAPNGAAEEIRR
jgi:hypothetical protein